MPPPSRPGTTGQPDVPAQRYTAALADGIETRWQAHWAAAGTFRVANPGEPGFDATKPKFYCLDMFPYPSGAGLHVGHPEGYTATDIICRYKRMRGLNVLHPMGWDAFGLPAEQYAIRTGVHPAETTRAAIDAFRRQLQRFGFSYDWSREFGTMDPDYYKWTQWVFLRIYNAWYDEQRGRARPIDELISALESGERAPAFNPGAAEVSAQDRARALGLWASLDRAERRRIIDSHRLAYVAEQTVNWCPRLGTALANEEVIDGRSERGGHPVFRRPLRQWMFRITAYAQRLLDDLATVDWPQSTRTMQTEWIGRSEGAEIDFALGGPPVRGGSAPVHTEAIRVYTTRPDTIFGATYMVVAPEHPLVDAVLESPPPGTDAPALRAYAAAARDRSDVERQEAREKTGVFTGLHAVNPATGEPIPVWAADYVLMGYGTGAIMAVPGHDERDHEFATRFGLPIVEVVRPRGDGGAGGCFSGEGVGVNSSNAEVSLDGLETAQAKERIIAWLERRGLGRRRVNYKLRDWLFSRQRYWGEPFPIVYDEHGDHHPVDEAALPVRLPELADYAPQESDRPRPLLDKAQGWVRTTAGEAGAAAAAGLAPDAPVMRETNTMPGWAGSCWYYLRFCDPHNAAAFVGREAERYWMNDGVDLYVGGAEHAVLHLLYARFWHKALFDLGLVSTAEPMRRLFHQGLITSMAYQREDASLVAVDMVESREDGVHVERATGRPVRQIVAKMSKSLGNVVNPDEVIAEYGADTFRLYEMYMGPLEASKPWNPRDIGGLFRFLQRAWRLAVDEGTGEPRTADAPDAAIERRLHRTVAKVSADIERLAFNTAIAAMIEFVNAATGTAGLTRSQLERFALMLAPFAPHMAEELWARLGHDESLAYHPWPSHDPGMLRDEEIELPVQIAGKVRARIRIAADADAAAIEAAALADEKVRQQLAGRTVRKVVVVPGKMVNVVVA